MKSLRLSASNRVLLLICVTYLFLFIDRANMGVAALSIRKEFGFSNTEMGFVFSAFSYSYVAIAWIGGWFADRFGPRITMFACGTVFSVATLLTGLSTGLLSLVAARLLLGLGEAPCLPTGTRAMGNWIPKSRWGAAQGIAHSASRGALALTPMIIAWLTFATSWRGSFIIIGAAGLIWMIVWFWLFRDKPQEDATITTDELRALVAVENKVRNVPYLRVFRRFFALFLSFFCHGWTLWVYLTWLPTFLLQTYQVDLKTSAFFSSGILTAGIIGNFFGGAMSDWIFRRTHSQLAARTYFIAFGFVMASICLIPVLLSSDMLIVTAALTSAFFFTEITVSPLWLVPLDVSPRYAGTASGVLAFGFGISGILSPITFGYLLDLLKDWHLPFATSIAFLLLGAVCAFWLHPERPFEHAEAEAKPVPLAA